MNSHQELFTKAMKSVEISRKDPAFPRLLVAVTAANISLIASVMFFLNYGALSRDFFLYFSEQSSSMSYPYLIFLIQVVMFSLVLPLLIFGLIYGKGPRRGSQLLVYGAAAIVSLVSFHFGPGEYPIFAFSITWILALVVAGHIKFKWLAISLPIIAIACLVPLDFVFDRIFSFTDLIEEYWNNR